MLEAGAPFVAVADALAGIKILEFIELEKEERGVLGCFNNFDILID